MSEALWHSVDRALADLLIGPDPALEQALAASADAGLPDIAVSRNLGRFLCLLIRMCGARRVLEVGTLGGYSTIWLARGVGPEGSVVTLELSEDHAAVAMGNLRAAACADRVDVRVGDATASLDRMVHEGEAPFDFVFLDADKEGYPAYLDRALALSVPGTVIVADNVVRGGAVFDEEQSSPVLTGVRQFLEAVAENPHLEAVGLPMVGMKGFDGIAIARVTE